MEVIKTPLCSNKSSEVLWWPGTGNGEYTVRSGYHAGTVKMGVALKQDSGASTSLTIPGTLWKTIWGALVPQKIKSFVWKLTQNSIASMENLWKRKLSPTSSCPICNNSPESLEHLFLLCEWTRAAWFGLGCITVPDPMSISSFQVWLIDAVGGEEDATQRNQNEIGKIFTLLWNIWKARNNQVYNQINVDPKTVLRMTNVLSMEYANSASLNQSQSQNQRSNNLPTARILPRGTTRWRPPIEGRLKLNTDASWLQNGRVTGGIVGRNYKGEVEVMHAISLMAQSPLLAETLVVREAVNLAANLNCAAVTIESDNQTVIEACRGSSEYGEIKGLVADIVKLKSCFGTIGFTWIARGGNKVAHQVARLKQEGGLPSDWCINLPLPIQQALMEDNLQYSHP